MVNRRADDREDERSGNNLERASDRGPIDDQSATRRAADLAADDQQGQGDQGVVPVMPAGALANANADNPGGTAGGVTSGQGSPAAAAIIADEIAFGQDDVKTGWPVVAADDTRIGEVLEVGPERVLVGRTDREGKIYIPYAGIRSLDDKTVHLVVPSGEIENQDWQQVLPEGVNRRSDDEPGPRGGSGGSTISGPSSRPTNLRSEPDDVRTTITANPDTDRDIPVTTGRGVEEGPTTQVIRSDTPDNTPQSTIQPTPRYTAEPGRVGGALAESSPAPTAPKPNMSREEKGPMRDARNMMENARDTLQGAAHGSVNPNDPKDAFADMFSFLENIPNTFYYLATVTSVLASLVLFLTGKRWESLFVGLWAPTIVSASMFYKLLRPSHEVRRM